MAQAQAPTTGIYAVFTSNMPQPTLRFSRALGSNEIDTVPDPLPRLSHPHPVGLDSSTSCLGLCRQHGEAGFKVVGSAIIVARRIAFTCLQPSCKLRTVNQSTKFARALVDGLWPNAKALQPFQWFWQPRLQFQRLPKIGDGLFSVTLR
jgi:hypothetical protein